jgi:hypothetical protein
MSGVHPEATIKCKARMSGYVKRVDGTIEPLEFTGGSQEQIIEVNYEKAVELFGQEKADELFKGVTEGGDFSE